MMSPVSGARLSAQHCPELVRTGPRPEERAEAIAAWRRALARRLASDLAGLLSGGKPDVRIGEPELLRGADVLSRIGPIAANCLLRCGGEDRTALVTFDIATAIALTDRSFGGEGARIEDAPDHLPRSAGLLVDKACGLIANALAATALGEQAPAAAPLDSGVIVRSESAARLKPFAPEAATLAVTITIADPGGSEWHAQLAMTETVFGELLPGLARSGPVRGAAKAARAAQDAAFGAIPLPVEGVLAEFEMSLARLDRLGPGDTIPLAVPGELPLRVGARVFARGQLGSLEDRIAIRLTRIERGADLKGLPE